MSSKTKAADQPQSTKRGAKPLATPAIAADVLDDALLAGRNQALATMGEHRQQVLDQFGDGLPWSPEHYEAAIRDDLRIGAEHFLRAGRRLVVMREFVEHGDWMNALARLGLGHEQARRMMAAAQRFDALPNSSTSRNLLDAAKSQGKIVELLSLPEDQFKELASDGATSGLTLDDVEKMTIRELRAAVREARADMGAKDERIGKLSADLNRAEEKTVKAQRKWKAATPDERLATLQQRIIEAELEIVAQLGSQESGLTAAIIELAEHCTEHDLDSSQFLGDVIGRLLLAVRTVRDGYEYGFAIPVVADGK